MSGKKDFDLSFKYSGTDFACFNSTAPPPPSIPVFPTEGVGKQCIGLKDDCGGDNSLCCGVAVNGKVLDSKGDPTDKKLASVSICNK